MKLTSFLKVEDIYFNVEASGKKRVLELVGKWIAESLNRDISLDKQWQENQQIDSVEEISNICPVECFGNLFKREKLGSTALNYGVALPHAKLPENMPVQIELPIAVFLKLDSPVDYEASDHKDVDLIFAIMFPPQSCEKFKQYLPAVAKKLSDKAFVKQLRSAENRESLWQLLDNEELAIEE